MPECFDPAWEYYEPDPYVAWVFARAGAVSGFDGLLDGRGLVRSMGLRFGRGDPNRCPCLRLAPERPDRRAGNGGARLAPRACPACGLFFRPARAARVHCSARCRALAQVRARPPARCRHCGAGFSPRRPNQVMCSARCGSLHGSSVAAGSKHSKIAGLDRFRELYLAGVRVTDAARELGVSPVTAKKWRRRLGLPPRGPRGAPPP